MDRRKQALGLAGWLAASFAAAGVGARFSPGEWYAALAKPSWTPPDAAFAPIWTALYVLMAVAAWRVWRRAGFAGAPLALAIYGVQLGLNAAWSWLFFGLHQPVVALIDVAALWLAIAVTLALFWRVERLAGALLVPYLAWVTVATALNAALVRLNPGV